MKTADEERAYHEPVLVKEVVHFLALSPGKVIIDCTIGHGGHSLNILKQLGGEGLLVGIDLNSCSLAIARRRIEHRESVPALVKFVQGNFADLIPLLKHAKTPPSGGILLDLGSSTSQLLDPKLGMSWESDEALDMRLDPQVGPLTAADIVNTWSEEDIARLLREKAQERWSRRIAHRLVEARKTQPIVTGRRLGELVAAAIPRKSWPPKIHPATRAFMALRIEVNHEFENLERVLPQAFEVLEPGGRLVVISFHSGEDRRVKRFFQSMAHPELTVPWPLPQKGLEPKPQLKILTRRPRRPSKEEIERNPRSRSARLRAAEKI